MATASPKDDGDNPMQCGDEIDSFSDTEGGGGSRGRAEAAVRTAASGTVAAAKAVAEGAEAASKATKRHSAAAASVVQGVVAGAGAQINQVVQLAVSGSASVHDKALDANYLDPLLRADMGGSYHRLFDGGHTIAGAVQAVNEAPIDDTLTRQTLGTVEALLRDVSTERGLPLATWDKATFDSVAQTLDSSLGIPKRWLYDLNTFDAGEVLGATVGVVAVALNWNRADTEQFAQVTASMGLSAAVGLNPLLLLVTVAAAAQSFNKARGSGDYSALADGAFRGHGHLGGVAGRGLSLRRRRGTGWRRAARRDGGRGARPPDRQERQRHRDHRLRQGTGRGPRSDRRRMGPRRPQPRRRRPGRPGCGPGDSGAAERGRRHRGRHPHRRHTQ